MKTIFLFTLRALAFGALLNQLGSGLFAQTGTALVRHGFSINGAVDGSVRQMLGENSKVNSGGSITGDILAPGTPTVVLNNPASYSGTVDGTGSTSPAGYTVTLQSGVSVRHIIRRTDAGTLPTVAAPPSPTGTVDVTVNTSGQSINFATLRNLTLGNGTGQTAVPPGTYGKLTANGATFVLGIAGATQPAVYNLQQLTLNSGGQLSVVGPVIINDAGNIALAGPAGSSANLAWLQLNISAGDLTLNSGGAFYGYVTAPAGTVVLNSTTQLIGGSISDKLTVNSNCVLRLIQPNQPPVASLTAPAANASFTAPATVAIVANASDPDGSVTKVEFFNGATKLGERTVPDSVGGSVFTLTYTFTSAGTYTLTAKATDNAGATTSSAAVTITVTLSTNVPPTVALTSPADSAIYGAPATITLSATASSNNPGGTITKVDFLNGSGASATTIGSVTSAPFTFTWSSVPPGTYSLTAKAYDSFGASNTSASRTVAVQVALPYFTGFEPADGYNVGALAGQVGWSATSSVVVTDAQSYRGAQSLLLPSGQPPTQAALSFPTYSGQNIVFLDVFAKPSVGNAPSSSIFFDSEVARLAFVATGTQGQLYLLDGDGAGGGTWRATGLKVAVSAAGQSADWLRFTLREDFTTKKWDLYANGALLAYDSGFTNSNKALLSQLTLFGGQNASAIFDDFFAGFDHPLFVNASKDGIDDAWKTLYGLSLSQNVRYTDPIGKGIPVIQGYMLGLNPLVFDTSGDGIPDTWELKYGLNPLINNAAGDLVGDGVSNLTKYLEGRDPTKLALPDTTGAIRLTIFQPN